MEIYKANNLTEAVELSKECLSGHEGVIIYVSEGPSVLTGAFNTLDRDACKRFGLQIGEAPYHGGTIVNMPGDLSLCITTWGNSEIAREIVDATVEWLEGLGVKVSRNNNDVLADEKKVISWARTMTISGWCQSVVHFSVGKMNLDLVKEICTKRMVKIPGSLSDYGITADDILAKLNLESENSILKLR